jgi:hypothetical protein
MPSHGSMRATTLLTVINLISEDYKTSEESAMDMFYSSHVGECYEDDETGLYGQSALYVFSLFKEEKDRA